MMSEGRGQGGSTHEGGFGRFEWGRPAMVAGGRAEGKSQGDRGRKAPDSPPHFLGQLA